jgi:hypothetical protein
MLKKIIGLAAVFLLALGISACEKVAPQILSEPGVTRLNGEQARAHISGNTETWREGTGYYNPNGEIEVIWRKVKLEKPRLSLLCRQQRCNYDDYGR